MRIKPTLALFALLFLLPLAPVLAADAPPSYFELTDAPTITVDWSKGHAQAVTLHGNRTLAFANGRKGDRYVLVITQDETGSRTLSWPSSVRWPGGSPPAVTDLLTSTAHKTDYLVFFYNGVTYDALSIARNY